MSSEETYLYATVANYSAMAPHASFHLRASQTSDASAIASIFAQSYPHAYTSFLPAEFMSRYTVTNQLERWTTHLQDLPAKHHIMVAISEDTKDIVGSIEIGPAEYQKDVGEVHFLFVQPTSIRRGVGRCLLRSGE